MKNMKKILALLVAVLMIAASVSVAMAENGYTITITNNDQISAHTYTAYKIFGGTLNAEKTALGNVVWSDDAAGAAFLSALQADNVTKTVFASATTAQAVSEVLGDTTKATATVLERFAELAATHFTTAASSSTESGSPYSIVVDSVGYYLVKDTGTIAEGDSATSIIMKVVGDTAVTAKSSTVPNEKKIVATADDPETTGTNEEERVDSNTAAVGDTVNYVVTSTIPDVSHYEKYFFIVHDNMNTGLQFDGTVTAEYGTMSESVFTKIGDIPATSLETRTATTDPAADTGDTFTCIVKDAKTLFADKAGKTIRFHYSATVTQDAVVGVAGNPNTEKIEYSNNPNVTPKGDNKPGPEDHDVTGETTDDVVITYVAGLEIQKVDGATGLNLAGAKFTITANELNQVKKVVKTSFEKADDGTYYKLIDGSYTTTPPTEAGLSEAAKAKYAEPKTDKYKSIETTTWETVPVPQTGDKVTSEYTVGDDGILHLEGLNAGTYTIHETKAPEGYNALGYDIIVKIFADTTPATVNANTDTATWKYQTKKSNETDFGAAVVAPTAIATIQVENNSGSTLPSTGGIGTTLFYIGGSILVLAAAILLITKRRMGSEE